MARVKYPFIVKYVYEDGTALFGCEPRDEGDVFTQVPDQLEASVYRNIKQFKAGFKLSPTAWLVKMRAFEDDGQTTELVYVGE